MVAISRLLQDQEPEEYGAVAVYPWERELADRYTLTSRFGDPVALWSTPREGKIGLPRALCPVGPNDVRTDGYPVDFKSKITPRGEEQAQAIADTVAFLKEGKSGLLNAPTGKGKTVMAIAAAAAIGRSTLVIATKDDLIRQWDERLMEHTGLKRHEIGRIQQDVCNPAGKVVTVGSLGSLAKVGRYPSDIWKMFGLVIFDEVHRLAADYFSTVAFLSNARLRLGLSATMKRTDGKEVVFSSHIGPVRVKLEKADLTPKILRYSTGWRCPRKNVGGVVQRVPHTANRSGHIETLLTKDQKRNMLITYLGVKAFEAKRHTVIFSTRVAHLQELKRLLIKNGVPGNQVGEYFGPKGGDVLKAQGIRPIVLATWSKMAEGTDIPSLDTCILATPRSNIEQAVGRILRLKDQKKDPIVFDLHDEDSPVFKGFARGRDKFYRRIGADVKMMEAEGA